MYNFVIKTRRNKCFAQIKSLTIQYALRLGVRLKHDVLLEYCAIGWFCVNVLFFIFLPCFRVSENGMLIPSMVSG